MAKITIDSFRGEAPRLTPRALPPNAAQVAINARLQSGDLESWRGMLETASLANDAQTIYLLNDEWLSWESDVDVARGPVAGDTTYRVYLTGPDEYDQPRFTNYALATTGSAPYPVATRPLGVPGPVSEPTLVVGVDSSPTTYSIDVLDEGDSLETNWVTSATNLGNGGTFSRVQQVTTQGNPQPSYELIYNEINNAGQEPYAYRNFSIGDAAVVHVTADVLFGGVDSTAVNTAGLLVACSATGSGVMAWYQNGSLQIRNATQFSPYSAAVVDSVAVTLAVGVQYTFDVTVLVNADGTQTVTVRVFQGSGELASVTGTAVFSLGGYCAITAASPSDAGIFATYFDNIHVQASGSNGYTPVNIATSYVYTFVNDLGEESVPSLPSSTIQRPDGVSVAVTTATAIPSGISSEYGIATKRIYRAATGNTGTVFRFVAEIDLATETYEDVLTDAQLGEVLESEEYDLPPDDLRGIRILPNGVMAGFSKNQLCLSAQNRPHAWPVGNRLTVDTYIVAISNIDTTVVVGTESFVYSASGNDPSAYSMSQPGARQACVSKRSMQYMNDQVGVVFASPDGLMAMTGPTTVRNVTEGVFTRRQWQDLVPETIQAAVHDDIYFFSYGTNSSASGGMFMLDLKASGFGLVRLDYFANAMFSDPLTDKLYMVQTDVSTETVMFLFHMTDAASGEGITEFTAIYDVADQTGATWTPNQPNWQLADSNPSPKFGMSSLGSSGSVIISRDTSQTNPEVTAEFDTTGLSTLQIDAWVYVDSSRPLEARLGVEVGTFSYPLETLFSFTVKPFGTITFGFEGPDEDSFNDTVGTIPLDEWVHVRFLCVSRELRVYVNGVADSTVITTISSNPVSEVNPINLGRLVLVANGMFMDDVRGLLGGSASTSNFTPPVAPWPNP